MGLIKKRQLFRDSTEHRTKKIQQKIKWKFLHRKENEEKQKQQKFRTKTHTQLFKERQTQYIKKTKEQEQRHTHINIDCFNMRNMLDVNFLFYVPFMFFFIIFSVLVYIKKDTGREYIEMVVHIFNVALNKYKMP